MLRAMWAVCWRAARSDVPPAQPPFTIMPSRRPLNSPVWSPDDILDAVAAAISQREADLRAEHAVHGLDSLSEVKFHTLLAQGLRSTGHGVLREQPYPHEWRRKRRGGHHPADLSDPNAPPSISDYSAIDTEAADPVTGELPDPRDRMRCDLVLTPTAGQAVGDPLAQARAARVRSTQAAGTLFAAVEAYDALPPPPDNSCPPEDAFWLEVKLIGQFCYSAGVPGPNVSYTAELLRGPTADARKLSADGRIAYAASLVLLFTRDESTADHDLAQAVHRCLDRNLPIASPIRRSLAITDRIGNGVLTACMIPVRSSL